MTGDAKWWAAKVNAAARELNEITDLIKTSRPQQGVLIIPTGSYTIANNGVSVTIDWHEVRTPEETITAGHFHNNGTWEGYK